MLQKQGFLPIKSFLKKIIIIFSFLNPRYQLAYDDDYFDIKLKDRKYRLKSFGDHDFPEFTFKEIKYNSSILFSINPHDLIKISEKNFIQEHLKTQLKIEEFLRNNLYKLGNEHGANTFSGDEICDNPLLADQIAKNDLFKIAYNTGFERGRKLSKMLNHENKINQKSNNVFELVCLSNNKVPER